MTTPSLIKLYVATDMTGYALDLHDGTCQLITPAPSMNFGDVVQVIPAAYGFDSIGAKVGTFEIGRRELRSLGHCK